MSLRMNIMGASGAISDACGKLGSQVVNAREANERPIVAERLLEAMSLLAQAKQLVEDAAVSTYSFKTPASRMAAE